MPLVAPILTKILLSIVVFSVLVIIHELGHFIVARIIGVRVEEFGFGLPPRIWGKKFGKHGTVYSLNWLPIGGFVKLAGEDESEGAQVKGAAKKEYFFGRSKKERAAILLAGVFMNLLLAVGITTFLLTQGVQEASGRVHVEQITADSPAKSAGLHEGDLITGIRYPVPSTSQSAVAPVKIPNDLITVVRAHEGEQVTFIVTRGGVQYLIAMVPRKTFPKGEGPTGIAISDLETKTYSWSEAPWAAVKLNAVRAWQLLAGIGGIFVKLYHFQSVGQDVAGPIGIVNVIGQAAAFGWKAVLDFTSMLSLELAIFNVLPIPALDGGRFAFVFLEKVLGRKVKPAFEQSTHQIGMIILFILIFLISVNDIFHLGG